MASIGDESELDTGYGATLPSDDNNSDLGSDDGFGFVGDDDDNISLEGIDDVAEVPPPYYPGITVCIVCEQRPPYSRGGKSYPTCGLRCATILENARNQRAPSTPRNSGSRGGSPLNRRGTFHNSSRGGSPSASSPRTPNVGDLSNYLSNLSLQRPHQGNQTHPGGSRQNNANKPSCVVCLVKPCRDSKYVTCGLTCAEKLCKSGPADRNMCDYCHRRPKAPGHNQCGANCRESAKLACLLCKSRPKYKRYHLCGKTCKQIATKSTPLILEAPQGHATYELVENKFKSAWKYPGTQVPTIKKIYKIIENKSFLQPYDRYKKSVGNEVFRYHGTTRRCTLGSPGNTQLCSNTACALCSILRTSFKTSLANPSGAFGAGVYSSSAANKAYSYTGNGTGAIILTKVVLGKVRSVNGWNEVMSCPPGFNSVVFDRQNGALNETIVYSDDAIRPVFLIVF